jgi:hypothetical protein
MRSPLRSFLAFLLCAEKAAEIAAVGTDQLKAPEEIQLTVQAQWSDSRSITSSFYHLCFDFYQVMWLDDLSRTSRGSGSQMVGACSINYWTALLLDLETTLCHFPSSNLTSDSSVELPR